MSVSAPTYNTLSRAASLHDLKDLKAGHLNTLGTILEAAASTHSFQAPCDKGRAILSCQKGR